MGKFWSVVLFSYLLRLRSKKELWLTSCQLLSENVSSKKTWPAAETTVAMAKDTSKSVAFMLC